VQHVRSEKTHAAELCLLGYGPIRSTAQQPMGSGGDSRRFRSTSEAHCFYETCDALKDAVAWVSMLQCIGMAEKKARRGAKEAVSGEPALRCQLDSIVAGLVARNCLSKTPLKTSVHRVEHGVDASKHFPSVVPDGECLWQGVMIAVETAFASREYEMLLVFPLHARILEVHEWGLATTNHLLDKDTLVEILQKRMSIDTGGGDLAKRVVYRKPRTPECDALAVVQAMLLGDYATVRRHADAATASQPDDVLDPAAAVASSPGTQTVFPDLLGGEVGVGDGPNGSSFDCISLRTCSSSKTHNPAVAGAMRAAPVDRRGDEAGVHDLCKLLVLCAK
jgi:hypothetical protein